MNNFLKQIVATVLTILARLCLRKYHPNIIALTGSVGKTSTKDMVFSVVQSSFASRKSNKSFNTELGLPLTILDLPNAWRNPLDWILNFLKGIWLVLLPHEYPKWLVLELGADHPGDIARAASWLHPRIGIITGIGNEVPVHVEFFPSIDALVKEKGELLHSLDSMDLAIINRDDSRAWGMRAYSEAPVLGYGYQNEAEVRASNYHISYDDKGRAKGLAFRIDYLDKSMPVRLCGVLGKGHSYSAMAAFTVGARLRINLVTVVEAINKHEFGPGRMRILEGRNETTLIDDTYNSSPSAVKNALETLHELKPNGGRKILVLGDMLELGQYSKVEHEKIGTLVRGIADVLVCVGEMAAIIGESALRDGFTEENVYIFDSSIEVGEFLLDFVQKEDIILLKASQSIRLERATEVLLRDPSQAPKLLVRQEEEWKSRR